MQPQYQSQQQPQNQSIPIELFYTIRGYENHTFNIPVIIHTWMLINDQWSKLGQTEPKSDPKQNKFTTPIHTELVFHVMQPMKFQLTSQDGSCLLGEGTISLGQICGSKGSASIITLKDGKEKIAKLYIQGEAIQHSSEEIDMYWEAKKVKNVDGWFDKSDPYLKFYRISGKDQRILVHQTPHIMDNLNPTFDPFHITLQKLCQARYDTNIEVECWDWQKPGKDHRIIGSTTISMQRILNQGEREFILHCSKGKSVGTLILSKYNLTSKPNFYEYVQGGDQLSFYIAIDFTGSNGLAKEQSSLHYIDFDGKQNAYQSVIQNIGEIVLAYDSEKRIPAYGFGARPTFPEIYSDQTSFCFPLTGNPSKTDVRDLQELQEAYLNAVFNCEFSGPTYMQYVIRGALDVARQNISTGIYSVLLVITDGDIGDMEAVVDLVVEASYLPLSIIFVGVGKEDFSKLRYLDNDNMQLTDSKGRKAARDLVQFVAYNSLKHPSELSAIALEELPKQLLDYKQLLNQKPNPPIQINIVLQ